MQPRQIFETLRPVAPRLTYFMIISLKSLYFEGQHRP